jgi:hypothetical protein
MTVTLIIMLDHAFEIGTLMDLMKMTANVLFIHVYMHRFIDMYVPAHLLYKLFTNGSSFSLGFCQSFEEHTAVVYIYAITLKI